MGGKFLEVVPPSKLVTTTGALDEDGKLLFEILHTLTLEDCGNKTKLTMRSKVIMATEGAGRYIGGFEPGMTQSLERLADLFLNRPEPLVLERTFNAPVSAVWNALTKVEEMRKWYFDLKEFKPEVGFEFNFCVEHEGFFYHHDCKVVAVETQKNLAYTWRYRGHEGDSVVTFELLAEGDSTRLRLTHEGLETFPAVAAFARKNFLQGWTQLIGTSLKEYVEQAAPAASAGGIELTLTRIFDAPRELVFKAWTDPKQIIQWFAPNKEMVVPSVKADVRVGGKYRIQTRHPDGEYFTAAGTYLEVKSPEKLVFTWAFEKDGAGEEYGELEPAESLVTLEFRAHGKKTELVLRHQKFATVESRDRHEVGWTGCLESLATFATTLELNFPKTTNRSIK